MQISLRPQIGYKISFNPLDGGNLIFKPLDNEVLFLNLCGGQENEGKIWKMNLPSGGVVCVVKRHHAASSQFLHIEN